MDSAHRRICLAAFLLDGALMVILTAMPFYVYDHFDGSVEVPANIGAAQSMLYALVCLGLSRWLDRNRHGLKLAANGGFFFCAGSAAAVLFPGLWGFAIVSTFAIIGMSVTWPSLHGWLGADPDPHRRARAMGRFNVAWSSGLATGPLIGGFLYDAAPLAPFIATFFMGAACFALLWTMPREEDYYTSLAHEPEPAWDAHALESERFLLASWIANGVGWALVGVTRLVFTKRVDDLVANRELRLLAEETAPDYLASNAASIYAVIAFLLAATSAVVFALMGRTHRWHHKFRYIAAFQIAAAAAFWVLGQTQSLFVMSLAFMVIGGLSGAGFFLGCYYSQATFARRRQRTSINEFSVGVGSFVGPIAVGYLAKRHGIATPFLYVPVAVAFALAIQFYLIHVQGRRPRVSTHPIDPVISDAQTDAYPK